MIMVALRLWMSSAIVMRRRKLVGAFSRNAPRGACICYPDSRIMRTDYARSGRRTHNDRSDRRKAARLAATHRSEEQTSELQSLMRISYAVFCLKKKK